MVLHERSEGDAARGREMLRLLIRIGRGGLAPSAEGRETAAQGLVELAQRRRWIEAAPPAGAWRLSAEGRAVLRRALSGQGLEPDGGTAARDQAGDRPAAEPSANPDESPLAWLRRHRGKDGAPFLAEAEFEAGERLRADFWYAGMTPRVTSSWSACGTGGGRRSAPGTGVELRDRAIAAQTRVRRALAAVGPELAGILIDVCCHLHGIEDVERRAAWPQRAGKVVLRVALAALARHYGLVAVAPDHDCEPPRVRFWGTADYRPTIDGGSG